MLKIIIILTLLTLCSCSRDKNASTILSSDSSGDSVSQILEFSVINAYRGGNRLWELKSHKLTQSAIDSRITASPVKLTLFDDTAGVSGILTADNGIANAKMDSLFVWGNVKIDATSGERLLSATLEWHKNEKLLLSEDLVEISTADGEIIRGRGFRAAENFEWWDFATEVSGNFPSMQAEFEKE